jgi:predicted transcriptional regulator
MAEDSSSQSVDPHLAEIVRNYVVKNSGAVDQLGELITKVHRTLSGLGTNTTAAALAPEKSRICILCYDYDDGMEPSE